MMAALWVLLAAPQRATASERTTITWILNDFPPFIVVDGALPGDGFIDAALRYIIERMPEYEHRFEVAGIARAVGLMQQGEKICHPALLKTPAREAFAVFSGPTHFALSHTVVTRRDRLDRLARYLGADGKVDVARLLADENLKTSLTEKRAFSPAIDQALTALGPRSNIQTIGVRFDSPFMQLAAGWIDYVFAYPVEPGWYRSRGRMATDVELVHLPVAGGEEYVVGNMACTAGAWGEEVTARIDAAVAAAGDRPPWIDREKELSDPAAAQRLEEIFQRVAPFGR